MLKMIIELDREKLSKSGEFEESGFYDSLDKIFNVKGLKKENKGIFVDVGREEDLIYFMAIASALSNMDWFRNYVKKWDWLKEGWKTPEDLIDTFKLKQ